MTSARRGISQHLMAEAIERSAKHWQHLGLNAQEAQRAAIVFTLVAGGHTRKDAFEAADAIAARQRMTVDVTSTDSISTKSTLSTRSKS